MIDIETRVIDQIYKSISAEYPKAVVENRYIESASEFPFIAVYEQNNSNAIRYEEFSDGELYNNLVYEVQIFTNDKLKKQTAKAIAQIVDEQMRTMGFSRSFMNPIPNIDRTIYRIAMRYTAIVQNPTLAQTDNTIYLYHT